MSRQFNLPTASTNDAKAFPYITTDFTVITFQHYSILFSRRNTKESEVLQQTGKIAGTSVRGNLHPVDIFLRQIPFLLGRPLIAFLSHPASGSFSYFLSFTPFFFIPSFCERRVREDVFFPFFFFSFYVAVSRDAVAISGDTATFSPVAATVSGRPSVVFFSGISSADFTGSVDSAFSPSGSRQ